MERRPLEVHFRIGRIPVAVEPSFWVMALLLGLSSAGRGSLSEALGKLSIWVAVVFVGVLVHELGHAFVCRFLGAEATVRLYAFGGVTFPDRRLSRGGDVLMALAGPFAGFVLAGLAFVASASLGELGGSWAGYALVQIMWVTLVWGILNLVPVLPLDGGHVLAGLLGPTRQRLTLLLSGLFAAGLAALAGYVGQLFLAVLFGLFALRNFQARSALRPGRAHGVTVDEALEKGWKALSSGDEKEAERIARAVLDQAPDPDSRNRARDLLAWLALAQSNRREALRQLERSEPPEAARALTWAMVLEALEEQGQALPYALRALEEEPSETSAQLAIRLQVHEGRVHEAQALAERFSWRRPSARAAALAEIDIARGEYASAARHYEAAWQETRGAKDAYNAACSFARAGEREQAVAWLRRALESGFQDAELLLSDPDLSSLRSLDEFGRLVKEMRTAS